MSLEETIEKLVDAKIAKASQGPQTVLAEYKGLDSQGKGWVVISGSTEATPISRAVVEANPGDTVSVTIGDGRAVMDANISNPSAGVVGVKKVAQTAEQAKGDAEKAIAYSTQASMAANSARASAAGAALAAADAQTTADAVHGIAEQAQTDAAAAKTAADDAKETAEGVEAIAEQARTDAGTAKAAAESAQSSANAATSSLSDVERVVGTVNWIAEHGSYLLTTDPAPVAGKAYYTLSGGTYALTEDTAVDAHKQYYESDGEGGYAPVTSPVVADIGSYYERSGMTVTRVDNPQASSMGSYFNAYINESVQNLVDTHVWVDSNGLNVASENDETSGKTVTTGWRIGNVFEMLRDSVSWFKLWVENNVAKLRLGRSDQSHVVLDSDSLDIEDSAGVAVASFGEYSHIGKQRNSSHVRISPSAFAVGTYTDSSGYSTPSKDPSYLDQGVLVGNNALVVRNGGYNTLSVNALGLQLKPANHLAASISDGDASFYKTVLGGEEKTASFGSNGWQVGLDDESHMVGDYHSLQMVDKDGDTYFHVSDLRDSDGFIVETFTAPGGTNVFSLMTYPSSNPRGWATIDGETATVTNLSTSSQQCTVSPTPEEGAVVVIGYIPRSYVFAKAFTFGTRVAAEQVGAMSFCEGIRNVARGEASHAEGEHNVANEYGAHAEGAGCTALGSMAHAEGSGTLAGYAAHAEGQDTTASQTGSHSQNVGTKAAKMGQTALGSYNVADTSSTTTHPSGTSSYGQYAAIIGNGTDDSNRSNALTVDWEGIVETAGRIKSGGSVGFSYSNLANRATISRNGDYIYLLAFDANDDYVGQYRFNMTTWGFACRFWNSTTGAWGSWESHVWNANASRTANTVLAAPNGSAGAATFRALVPDDCSWLGTRKSDEQSSAISVANTSWTAIASVSLTAGTWVVTGTLYFASNSTGRRYACIHSTSPTTQAQRQSASNSNAVSGAATILNVGCIKGPTSTTTYSIYAYQSSGAALNCTGYITAVRIA